MIAATIRYLFVEKRASLDSKNLAYRALTLFYALRHKEKPWSSEALTEMFGGEILKEDAYKELMSELQPDVLGDVEQREPV